MDIPESVRKVPKLRRARFDRTPAKNISMFMIIQEVVILNQTTESDAHVDVLVVSGCA